MASVRRRRCADLQSVDVRADVVAADKVGHDGADGTYTGILRNLVTRNFVGTQLVTRTYVGTP